MENRPNILIVEDDVSMREFLCELLVDEGYNVDCSANGGEAIKRVDARFYDIVVTDIVMPEVGGVEVLKYIKDKNHDTSVIVITAYSTIKQAVELVKMGADDYFNKPFNIDDLLLIIRKTIDYKRSFQYNKEYEDTTGESNIFPEIVGNGKALMPVFDMMEKVAKTNATILIQGESGTGKELVARAIHDRSPRGGHAFIPINCGAIPESLLESELFGHEKGAFTGAVLKKHGLFEIANKGTIFLDEVGEMGLFLQVKLLRVLETGIFRRIGDTRDINVDVRIIAASNKNLREAVERKEFRGDIFYRLNVFPINLPPLRERKEDIPLLIQWFLKKHKLSEKNVSVSKRVSKVLCNYYWPGNVRELENVIQRAGILSLGKTIKEEHLSMEIRYHDDSMLCGNGIYDKIFKDSKAEFEKTYLERLLERTSHDITKASRIAGLTRAYIYEMMKKHNINYQKKKK